MTAFDRLHPALQHHIVNSLGWTALRPLQEQAIEPLLARAHALVIGPTAGGKTEAVVFPLLSRMLAEDWRGLGLLYVCPIKALLNNLEPRLATYGRLVGRRVERWHGDIADGARRRIARDPPDMLLTTPESIEVMLVSRRSNRRGLFGQVRAVVVDELHAFAGDDRGWHLLSVLERVTHIAGHPIQRVGLSATIGNPDELLAWLAATCEGPRCVIRAAGESPDRPDLSLDYVGSLDNAAKVIAELHRGEKRLVFADSRAGVERLASGLRSKGVSTFVSHSSLGVDERRRAEAAFAEATDCVIVATSTLELGIDVGDLDRVIQVNAPTTVSAFLQRLGRSGRRPGTRRNCLFLCTTDDALLQAAALVNLRDQAYVEPIRPPAEPTHVLAQQLLALCLQQGGMRRGEWREWIGRVPAFAAMSGASVDAVLDHMVAQGLLFEEAGILSMGDQGERSFGYRNFMELFSVFDTPPLFTVLHGRAELGHVHEVSFHQPDGTSPILSLGGRSWAVTHIDWRRRVAYVEPTTDIGHSRWIGAEPALHLSLCQAIQAILAGSDVRATLYRRAQERLERAREAHPWVEKGRTTVVTDPSGHTRWWTFAGLRANTMLADYLASAAGAHSKVDNLAIPLPRGIDIADLRARLRTATPEAIAAAMTVDEESLDQLKFSTCLPPEAAERLVRMRLMDREGLQACLTQPIAVVRS